MNSELKPKIRFKGFTDDWEQRKLEDFGSFTGGTSIESEFEENGKYKVISIGSYSETSKYNDQGIRCRLSEKTINKILNKDDLTMILNDKTSSGNILGRVLIINKSGEYVYNQRTERIEPNIQKYYPQFLYHMLNAPNIRKKIIKQSQGNTQIFVNWTGIQKLEYLVPKMDEQINLAKLIGNLDNLITLHQRKCDKLVELKKSLLEKMFPQNNSVIPEIRFKGFTDDWEQRKLGDYCEMFNGDRSSKYPNAQDIVPEGIPFINAGDLVDGHVNLTSANRITREKYDDLGGAKLQLGDIVYCLRGTLGKNAYIDNLNEGTVASSLVAIRPQNIDGRYLYQVLNSDIEYRQRIVRDEGAAQPNLSAKSVSEYLIPVPNIEEQTKISNFLTSLDNTITLHQRKHDKLNKIKQSLLNDMFV